MYRRRLSVRLTGWPFSGGGFCAVRCNASLGVDIPYFLSNASKEIVLPARTSLRAVSMILQNCGFVLSASDSRSTFRRDTRAATGRFFSVKTTVSCSEPSANSRSGRISFGICIVFICASPRRQRTTGGSARRKGRPAAGPYRPGGRRGTGLDRHPAGRDGLRRALRLLEHDSSPPLRLRFLSTIRRGSPGSGLHYR